MAPVERGNAALMECQAESESMTSGIKLGDEKSYMGCAILILDAKLLASFSLGLKTLSFSIRIYPNKLNRVSTLGGLDAASPAAPQWGSAAGSAAAAPVVRSGGRSAAAPAPRSRPRWWPAGRRRGRVPGGLADFLSPSEKPIQLQPVAIWDHIA